MLELKNVVKDYLAGDNTVHALRGVSLQFRSNEFVSILGPSGCGKTTMLNIIGGLDRYTSGDLVINGRTTKGYKDRDWDTYRNHSIGFVFQSYNLIPHQTVLQNVELALTLSGVSKGERKKRAISALKAVGLIDQLHKRPSELSGGQMQRVAIARAIVNDPDIILADEPTGALDSETSIQVMEILKEISKDRLVIMVTHNPELAERYSTRTVRMLDGQIVSDTHSLSNEEISNERRREQGTVVGVKATKKPSMSFVTSFGLSLRNLFTKKTRTLLTSFAGSIGIIGITLIYAVSQGTTNFINLMQEETLSSYPLTLEAEHVDIGSLMMALIGSAESQNYHDDDNVYQKPVLKDLVNTLANAKITQNDLRSFKTYLENKLHGENYDSVLKNSITGVRYSYDFDLQIYTENVDGNIIRSDTQKLIQTMLIKYMAELGTLEDNEDSSSSNSVMSMFTNGSTGMSTLWEELLPGDNGEYVNPILKKQYQLIHGNWPSAYNEVVLVVDENNEIDDMTLYALGLISEEEIDSIIKAAVNKESIDFEERKWSYDEICSMEFRTILNADCFSENSAGLYTDVSTNTWELKALYEKATVLKVSGIIRLKEDATVGMLSGSIGYTAKLTEYIVENNASAKAIQAQLANPTIDIFTGLPFKDDGNMDATLKMQKFHEYIAKMTDAQKYQAYLEILSIPDSDYVAAQIKARKQDLTPADMRAQLLEFLKMQVDSGSLSNLEALVENMSDEAVEAEYSLILDTMIRAEYAYQKSLENASRPIEELLAEFEDALSFYTSEQCGEYYDAILEFSTSNYEMNLKKLGYVQLDNPSAIYLYASTFENKDLIEAAIASYNAGVDELSQISYTDYVGLMMSSITTIIDAITYVLIAFVAVSLIVSSIMIGVITLISVQERTKEIGILRAIGASKRNVSRMFNAETLIIGFTSGALGVAVTWLLCIPINLILYALTGIPGLKAVLPIEFALIMISISMFLTLISGVIPSRSAAKKDPVVALRTE